MYPPPSLSLWDDAEQSRHGRPSAVIHSVDCLCGYSPVVRVPVGVGSCVATAPRNREKNCPASRKDQHLRVEVAPGLIHERVVLTLKTSGPTGTDHTLETLLTSLEARQLGHAVLDALGKAQRRWPVSVRPVYKHEQDQRFEVTHSDDPHEPVVMMLRLRRGSGAEGSFGMPLTGDEAHRLGHSLLAAANPSRPHVTTSLATLHGSRRASPPACRSRPRTTAASDEK
jgi:hypothetical protein